MAQVFAGFICGFAISVVAAPLLAWRLMLLSTSSSVLTRLLPSGISIVPVAFVLHFFLLISLTAVGMVLGLFLLALDGEAGALGSANAPFTILVFGLVLAISAPFAIILIRLRPYIIAAALVFLVVFGWLMPHMANWSKFD